MRTMKAVALAFATLALCTCRREDSSGNGGPGERAGRELDRALNKAGQAVEKAGRDMQKSSKGESTDK